MRHVPAKGAETYGRCQAGLWWCLWWHLVSWNFVCFLFPSSVVTLGVLTVGGKHRCLIGGVAHPCPANSLPFTAHSCLPQSSKCISPAQGRRIWVSAAGACRDCALNVVPSTFSDMVVTSWQAQGKPRALVIQSRLFVTSARDRSGFKSNCRFHGRCSAALWTLGMVVIFEAL